MHDFVSYLFYLLQRGMRFAVPAALVCGLILAVCYAVCRRQGRRFPWGKAVCAVLLVGWATVTAFVTMLRSEPNEYAAQQCKLHCRAANSFGSLRSSVTKTVTAAQPTSSTAQTAFPHGKRRPFLRQTA